MRHPKRLVSFCFPSDEPKKGSVKKGIAKCVYIYIYIYIFYFFIYIFMYLYVHIHPMQQEGLGLVGKNLLGSSHSRHLARSCSLPTASCGSESVVHRWSFGEIGSPGKCGIKPIQTSGTHLFLTKPKKDTYGAVPKSLARRTCGMTAESALSCSEIRVEKWFLKRENGHLTNFM